MADISPSELILIRHGPTDMPGHLCGRTDVGLAEMPVLAKGSPLVGVSSIWVSPASRACETAEGLWPGRAVRHDERLWEQNFGGWDGLAFGDVPDVGTLARDALVDLAGPGGESFRDVCTRVRPALGDAAAEARKAGPVAIVAHAGVVRASLAAALGDMPGALAFEIDHLSVTRLRCLPEGAFSVISVNGVLP